MVESKKECKEPGCTGEIVEGVCSTCGASAGGGTADSRSAPMSTQAVRALLDAEAAVVPGSPGAMEELLRAAAKLQAMVPDDYQSWRLQADLLVAALRRLETRQIQADPAVKLMGIAMREKDLRDAAETALRNCAHFAQNEEERIALIDQANRVRQMTWV